MTKILVCDMVSFDWADYAQKPSKSWVFCLARPPCVEGVQMPSERAAFAYPASVNSTGLTASSKSWNGRSLGRQGNEPPGFGAVSYEGLIPGIYSGERPSFYIRHYYERRVKHD